MKKLDLPKIEVAFPMAPTPPCLSADPAANATPAPALTAGLTVMEMARVIKYNPESVRRACREGRIKALVFGISYRIPPSEVTRILAEGLPTGQAAK